LTLRDIGMMLASNSTYRKKYKGHKKLISLKTFMTNAKINIMTKRTLERWLISLSNLPILVRCSLEFIVDLVYLPVKITIPIICPAANTVLAQAVLSKDSDYFFPD
jgi:hypothetical protein